MSHLLVSVRIPSSFVLPQDASSEVFFLSLSHLSLPFRIPSPGARLFYDPPSILEVVQPYPVVPRRMSAFCSGAQGFGRFLFPPSHGSQPRFSAILR